MALGNGSLLPANSPQVPAPIIGRSFGNLMEESLGMRRQLGDLPGVDLPIAANRPGGAERFGSGLTLRFQFAGHEVGGIVPFRVCSPSSVATQGTLPAGRLTGPVQLVRILMAAWEMVDDEMRILLGFEEQDLPHFQSILAGYSSIRGRDVKDRISILLHIRKSLHALFRNLAAEREWLDEEQGELSGRSPRAYLLEGSMISLFRVKEFVDEMCGR